MPPFASTTPLQLVSPSVAFIDGLHAYYPALMLPCIRLGKIPRLRVTPAGEKIPLLEVSDGMPAAVMASSAQS